MHPRYKVRKKRCNALNCNMHQILPYLLESKSVVFIEIPNAKLGCWLRFEDGAPPLPSMELNMQHF